jgi:hypothetical protein
MKKLLVILSIILSMSFAVASEKFTIAENEKIDKTIQDYVKK